MITNKCVGEQLQERREQYGLSLDDVAKNLRIKEAVLQGIEKSEVEGLLPLNFVKGFIRAYASFLGLDEGEISRQFEKEQALAQEEENQEKEKKSVERETEKPRFSFFFGQMRLPVAIASGVLLLGLLFWVEDGWQALETRVEEDYQEDSYNNYADEYTILDEEEEETQALLPTVPPKTEAQKVETRETETKVERKEESVVVKNEEAQQSNEIATAKMLNSMDSRIKLKAKKAVSFAVYKEGKEIAQMHLAEGALQQLPEGRAYYMMLKADVEEPNQEPFEGGELWQQIQFVVDNMEVNFAINSPQNLDSQLVLDGYAIASGNWEWVTRETR